MKYLSYFVASFSWNYALGMTWLVVPLFAHGKGFSALELGVLFSIPSIAQLIINVVGGAYVDRVGGKRIMFASCLFMAAGAATMPFMESFAAVFGAQLVLVLSRATFWPANWAIAADLPGDRGVQAGRLNALTNLGQILGNGTCGFILAASGYTVTFFVMAGLGAAAAILGIWTPSTRAKSAAGQGLFSNYVVLLRMPVMFYGTLCAYLSALPFSLIMSFYPLLLQEFGYGEEASGVLLAVRAIGGIAAGLVVAKFVSTGPKSPWAIIAGAMVAIMVGLQPLVTHWAGIGVFLFTIGVAASLLTVYFQVTMGEVVPPGMRGSAMALGGLGWGFSHLSTPLIMGFLAQRYGISGGFYALGIGSLAVSIAIGSLRGWAFAGTALTKKIPT